MIRSLLVAPLLFTLSAVLAYGQASLPVPADGGAERGTPVAGGPVRLTEKQQVSYAVGYDFGRRLLDGEADLDNQAVVTGLEDGLVGKQSLLSDEQLGRLLTMFEKEMQAREAARMKKYAAQNQKTAEAFLSDNEKREGVQVRPSGLQYKIVKKGTGPSPTAKDVVRVHYRGMHVDNSEFDSSYARGEPTQFPVGRVIEGWAEALQLMHVGGKWQLFIPPALGYREQGTPGGPIAPNEVLVFEVELLGIVPQ